LLLNALTIRPLLEYFGLHKYDPAELFVRGEGILSVLRKVRAELDHLLEEKAFAAPVLQRNLKDYQVREQKLQGELDTLKGPAQGFNAALEEKVFLGQCLTMERRAYLDLYARGMLPERTTKVLQHSVDLLFDRLKAGSELPVDRYSRTWTERTLTRVVTALEGTSWPGRWAADRKVDLLADAYDIARGLHHGCRAVVEQMEELGQTGAVGAPVLAKVQRRYRDWMHRAHERMQRMAVQYPEYVEKVQALLAGRLCLNLELEGYRRLGELDVIPEKVVGEMLRDIEQRMTEIRRLPRSALRFDTRELLRQVPFFQRLTENGLEELARRARQRAVLEDEVIFREGDRGNSLYLIARGAVRISMTQPERVLAVLGPGEFFGEIALLSARPRTATATAATPAHLVELRRDAVEEAGALVPELRQAMIEAYRERLVDQALARHPAFADLDRTQRQTLLGFLRPLELDPGQTLAADQPCFVVVRSGELRVNDRVLVEGDLHGTELWVQAESRAGPLQALGPAALFVLGPVDLDRVREAAPVIPILIANRLQSGPAGEKTTSA
jgi:CRP-like cAMP-binding protein